MVARAPIPLTSISVGRALIPRCDEAVYRDATGNEMQRTRMPGGTVACSYDGRELSIGGVSYFRL
ncbi:hypothetical protein L550_3415 [Bordetella pertussis H973]|uniref:Uncharacterized protein n=1 Tax=Bordetella pertussis CHLA-26 TaxID=1331284 RepID=A0AAI9J6X7_BORPT|nr:hypothetical protein V483_3155 [Bordetella pertussis CHLA-11]ETH11757.1 hypothetical protein L574_1521 [Bordetella pertussis STO1-SEAT-0006]ETH14800.1 hypothetical protein L575_2549 [Bordetella pertussis STO1-SEAT-0007]ETH32974.1 hypothetical protein L566_1040 [Bordetella pertussis CHLA-26]ETH34602.1 hypothetical protein L546_3195 [Bordetella pertussis H897]ETH37860.1 hypothetical protein L547_3372 [Bordetella pertussis H918]ETH42215.1 hypothetical protein L549_1450 [Bordetella pertussis H